MAVEIPLRGKYRRQDWGTSQKSRTGNGGTKKVRATLLKGEREAAMEATKANQRVIVLMPNLHRRKMTVPEWEAMDHGPA